MARIIASDYHESAENEHPVEGQLSAAAEAHINQIIEDMSRSQPRRKPNREVDISEVLTVQSASGQFRTEISDLYVSKNRWG